MYHNLSVVPGSEVFLDFSCSVNSCIWKGCVYFNKKLVSELVKTPFVHKPYDPKLTSLASVSTYCLGPVIHNGCHLYLILQIQIGTQWHNSTTVCWSYWRSACYSVGHSCLYYSQAVVKHQLIILRSQLFLQAHQVRETCNSRILVNQNICHPSILSPAASDLCIGSLVWLGI